MDKDAKDPAYKYIRVYPGTDIAVESEGDYTVTFVLYRGNKFLKVPKWVKTKVTKQQKRVEKTAG